MESIPGSFPIPASLMKNSKKPRLATAAAGGGGGGQLSEDLVELGILPHLPAKSLTRFQSVSKKWRRLISEPTPLFVHLQSLHAPYLLLEFWSAPSRYISRNPISDGVPCRGPSALDDFYRRSQNPKIVASCNGLVCILEGQHDAQKILIGNPLFKAWKSLPVPYALLRNNSVFGLAVDVGESTVRYRLVVVAAKVKEINIDDDDYGSIIREYDFHVFCSELRNWNVVGRSAVLYATSIIGAAAVYVEGTLYWMIPNEGCVLQFNAESGHSGLQALPPGAKENPWHGHIGVSGGKFSYGMIADMEIQMWSLDKLEWYKLFSISLGRGYMGRMLEAVAPVKNVRFMPFEGRDFLVFSLENVIFSYQIQTGVPRKQSTPYDIYPWFPYKNTIVSLPIEEDEGGDGWL